MTTPPSDQELEEMIQWGHAAMALSTPQRLSEGTQYTLSLENGQITLKVKTWLGGSAIEMKRESRAHVVNKKLEKHAANLLNSVAREYCSDNQEEKEGSDPVKDIVLNK